jgi:hypothetical protein
VPVRLHLHAAAAVHNSHQFSLREERRLALQGLQRLGLLAVTAPLGVPPWKADWPRVGEVGRTSWVLGFPQFHGQADKGHAMTIKLSIDDKRDQDQSLIHGLLHCCDLGALSARVSRLQSRGSTPWAPF